MRREPVKGGTVLISNLLFNFLLIAYNSSRGLRNRRAYACRFPGIVLAWGRQNRRREHSLNPVNRTATFQPLSCAIFAFLPAKTMPNNQKFQPILLSMIF